jgi:Putative DNA-binding domain
MGQNPFALGKAVNLEESLTCEFTEVGKGQSPVQAIGKAIDRYMVGFLNETAGSVYWGINDDRRITGVKLDSKGRDEVRQVAGQNISRIVPPVHSDWYSLPFHQVVRADDVSSPVNDTFVVELRVAKGDGFFFTGVESPIARH